MTIDTVRRSGSHRESGGGQSPRHAPPGLKGLVVADTEIGSVRGDEGFYHYRQYDAATLARDRSVEEIWYLLIEHRLPESNELAAFCEQVGGGRVVDEHVLDLVREVARHVEAPHLVLQSALPMLLPHAAPTIDLTPARRSADVLRVCAATPTILAVALATRNQAGDGAADPGSGHAADWLRMVTGGTPTPQQVRAVESYLAATIDHGFNASTFATRVVTSTGADVAASMSAGVGALSGPLHGGAPARALAMIEDIGDPSNTERWVRTRLAEGDKIMGFGHAVYRAGDPRSQLMHDVAHELAAQGTGAALVERAVEIEQRVLAELRRFKPSAVIVTNVEYYAGIVLHLAGVPAEAFTSCFTVSRVIGWGAHLLEQANDNKIMRPAARYVGPEPLLG